jgi:hypothetical protein
MPRRNYRPPRKARTRKPQPASQPTVSPESLARRLVHEGKADVVILGPMKDAWIHRPTTGGESVG